MHSSCQHTQFIRMDEITLKHNKRAVSHQVLFVSCNPIGFAKRQMMGHPMSRIRWLNRKEYQGKEVHWRCDICSVWVLSYRSMFCVFSMICARQCSVFSVWYAAICAMICAYHAVICAYHAVICAMICVAGHDMRIRKWHVFLNISQVLLNISLLKSFLLMIYVFKWHNLTILDM